MIQTTRPAVIRPRFRVQLGTATARWLEPKGMEVYTCNPDGPCDCPDCSEERTSTALAILAAANRRRKR